MDFRPSNTSASPPSVGSNGSPIPISGERHSTPASRIVPINPNKRPRLAPIASDHLHDSHIHPSQSSSSTSAASATTFPFRLDVDLTPFPPSNHLSSIPSSLSHSHATPHPSLTGLYAAAHTNGVMHSQNTPPFIPQPAFDFSRHQPPPPLRSVSFPTQSYGQQQQYSQHRHPAPSQHVSSNNMFVELLSSTPDGHGSSQSQFPTFDWPVHTQQTQSIRSDPGIFPLDS